MAGKSPCSDVFTSLIKTISKEIIESMPHEITTKIGDVNIECNVAEYSPSAGVAYVQENRIVIHESGFSEHPRPERIARTLCHELSHIYNYRVFNEKYFYNESGRKLYYYGHGSPTFKEFAETCYNGWEERRDANMDISKGIE